MVCRKNNFNGQELIISTQLNCFKHVYSSNSVQHYTFVYTKLNTSKYCYLRSSIKFNNSPCFIHWNVFIDRK